MHRLINKKNILCICLIIFLLFLIIFVCRLLFQNKDVNIISITDKNYVDYARVAIKSAIVNKKPSSKYHFYIICVDLDKQIYNKFKILEENNVDINIIPVKLNDISYIGPNPLVRKFYVTRSVLYTFLIPNMFPELDKILYLDTDIIVLKDLTELYNKNIKGKYLAAALRYDFYPIQEKDVIFFNCGVMLMNLKKMREDNMVDKLIEAKNADEERLYHNQVIFNKVIDYKKDIKVLAPYYNNSVTWSQPTWYFARCGLMQKYPLLYWFYPNIKNLDKKTVVAHWTGWLKPWKYYEPTKLVRFVDDWWKYAEMVDKNFVQKNRPFGEFNDIP